MKKEKPKAKSYAEIAEEHEEKKKTKKAPKLYEMRDAFFEDEVSNGLLYNDNDKSFYKYSNGAYLIYPTDEFETMLDEFILRRFAGRVDVTTQTIRELTRAIIRVDDDDKTIKVSGDYQSPRSAFKDKTFNFETFEVEEHDPRKPCFHKFDFDLPTKPAQTPAFDSYFDATFINVEAQEDPELKAFMIDVMAYYISPVHSPVPVGIILHGSGSNGKSIFLKLIRWIVGEQFCSALSMEDLSEKFGAAELIGKKVNIVDEDQSRYVRPDKIKALITRDRIKAERKFEAPFFFTPQAKHIISTNKELKFEDIDYAITRRLNIVPFLRTFVPPNGTDPSASKPDGKFIVEGNLELEDQLKKELPAIVYKLIQKLKDLKARKYILKMPKMLASTKRELEISSSSALEFFHQYYEYNPDYEELVSTEMVYEQYKGWYEFSGKPERFMMQPRHFWDVINKNFPSTKTEKKTYYMQKRTGAKQHMYPIRFNSGGDPGQPNMEPGYEDRIL